MSAEINYQQEKRLILGALADLTLVFPSSLVAEIIIVERLKILNLPFYDRSILGCVHHGAQIIPLVSLRHILLGEQRSLTKERLTVVHLKKMVEKIPGIGLIIDGILGSKIPAELPTDLFNGEVDLSKLKMWLFRTDIFPSQLWQPSYLAANINSL